MKRILLLLIAFAAAAFAGWYYWNFSQRISSAPVSTLLPRETIFLAHMPDFNRTLDEWYRSDIYQLYSEAAVQDFLRPALGRLANIPKTNAASQTLREIEQLDPKHAFFALSSVNNNSPKFVGGFRFRGSQQEAEAIINRWRSTFLAQNPSAKREKLQYQQHEIELVTSAAFTLATTYDGPWFFAATDVTELKELLDRASTVQKIQKRHSRKMQRTEWRLPTGPRTMRYSFTCSQRGFLSGLRLCAPLFDPARLPASLRCSRKCVASRVRCGSTTAKYTTCFFSGCRSWSVAPPLRGHRYRWGQKKPFFICRCF